MHEMWKIMLSVLKELTKCIDNGRINIEVFHKNDNVYQDTFLRSETVI